MVMNIPQRVPCVLSTVLQTSSGVVAAAASAPAAAPDTACASGLYVRDSFTRDWHHSYVTKCNAWNRLSVDQHYLHQ